MDADEELPEDPEPAEHAEPRPVDRWRQNTASGAITAALALGFRHVFEPERSDTVSIEQEAPERPVDTEGVELRFDPISSRSTVVVVHQPEPADPEDQSE